LILNHLNLAVSHVQEAREFLIKYFGLDPEGKKGNDTIAFLRDDSGMVLTLTNIDGAADVRYPGAFHIGFIQPSPEKVDEINRRLKDDGFDVPPPARMHGSWTFYFRAPGGFVVEVLA
jgi:catechol 2,3-dioxygenase-like lactoylglutathione lyase family enzyme